MKVSILTPVYGKWNFTQAYLQDLARLDPNATEIIVVNNASPDNTTTQLAEWQQRLPNLKVINNDVNRGFGYATNQAYQASTGDYILCLNNDIRVKSDHSNWVFQLAQHCTDTNLVGPTGGKVDPRNEFAFVYETGDPTKEINYLSGWCMLGKRSVWEKLVTSQEGARGPFDANTFFAFYEDTDLSFRAKQLGISLDIYAVPVVHFGHITANTLNLNKLYTESKRKFLNKWSTRK